MDGVDVYTVEPRDTPGLQNYVVDLKTHLILGETGCNYFGTLLSAAVDLGTTARERAFAFLEAKKNPAFRKHGRDLDIAVDTVSITNEGVIKRALGGQTPEGDGKDDQVLSWESYRLRNTPSGWRLEALQTGYSRKKE